MRTFFDRTLGNLRSALRQLALAKSDSVLTIATLSIGVAVATAILTVGRGVVLRPLPYAAPEQLVVIAEFQPGKNRDQQSVSYADLEDFRRASRSFADIAGFSFSEFVVSGEANAERVFGAQIESGLLPLLGAPLLRGRAFERGDDGANAARKVILSYGLWQRRYGGDTALVGKSITIDGEAYTVSGITTTAFEFPRSAMMARDAELWVPLRAGPMLMNRRGMRNLLAIGRLKADSRTTATNGRENNSAVAAIELTSIATRLSTEYPSTNAGWSVRLLSLHEYVVGGVQSALVMLAAFVLVLLLIVCVNSVSATVARCAARIPAIATRLALGASMRDIAELLMMESLVYGVIAGIIAMPASVAVRALLLAFAPVDLPRQAGVQLDASTIAAGFFLAVVVSCLNACGALAFVSRLRARRLLNDPARTASASKPLRRAMAAMMVSQLALATVLLGVTAALFLRYSALEHVNPGFRFERVQTATIALPGRRYQSGAARTNLTERYLTSIRAMPEVERAAVVSLLPMAGGMMSGNFAIIGDARADSTATAVLRSASTDFFETVSIPVKRGRSFASGDDAGAERVVIVNEALVRQFLANRDPLNTVLRVTAPGGDSAEAFRVVGVVGDALEKGLTSPPSPILYFSNSQTSFPHTTLVVRTLTSRDITAQLRTSLAALDKQLALDDVVTLTARVRSSYALQIFYFAVLVVFAVCACVLVGIGLFALLSAAVIADAKSIAIRMAIGATAVSIARAVVVRSLALGTAGCLVGCAVLAALRPQLSEFTAGTALTARSLLLGSSVLVLVAILAGYFPALAASRSDPAKVLRS